jgi:hypothetical protein
MPLLSTLGTGSSRNFGKTIGRRSLQMVNSGNLLLHLDPADLTSYPGTGTTWTDLSVNGYSGSFTGTVSYESPAFNINASDVTTSNWVTVTPTIAFADLAEYSWDCYIKLNADAEQTLHSIFGRGSTTQWFLLQTSDAGGTSWSVRYRDTGGVYRNSSTVNYDIKQNWANITLTVDSSRTLRFYFNGKFIETLPTPTSTVFTISRLGGGYSSGSNRYSLQGLLGKVAMFTRVLGAEEIRQNFTAYRGRYGI